MQEQAYRVEALDLELGEILQEADQRAATQFVLDIDTTRERLAPFLVTISRQRNRIMRRLCDKKDDKPDATEDGRFKFTTEKQQEDLQDAITKLGRSEVTLPDDLMRIKKSDLIKNGLGVSGLRISNLRPLLAPESAPSQERGES